MQAVPEREREDLFHEGQKEKDRRDKEEKKLDKKRKAAAFRELLESIVSIQVGCEGAVGPELSPPRSRHLFPSAG